MILPVKMVFLVHGVAFISCTWIFFTRTHCIWILVSLMDLEDSSEGTFELCLRMLSLCQKEIGAYGQWVHQNQ